MAVRSLLDQLTNLFGNALTDVREKLIEEAWFGRTTAPQERMSQDVGDLLDRQSSAVAPAAPLNHGEFIPQRSDEHGAPIDRGNSNQLHHDATPRPQALSWDEISAQMAKARSYEPEQEVDRDMER